MPTDPIVAEIRAIREAHAARFNYDVSAIFRDILRKQEALGNEYVRRPPRCTVALKPVGEPVESAGGRRQT